jgi:hypothetical protein
VAGRVELGFFAAGAFFVLAESIFRPGEGVERTSWDNECADARHVPLASMTT